LKDKTDEIAIEISKRQWIDWTDLRFCSLPSTKINKRVELLARQIRDLISDKASIINGSKEKREFPPNSVLRKPTGRDMLPSLYVRFVWDEKNEDHPPQQITLVLRSTGDKKHDRRRIQSIYGTLISFPGKDRFSFHIFDDGKGHLIDFPDDTTRVCSELIERLKKLMGEENWRVEELTF
jgi:hypothetical protein